MLIILLIIVDILLIGSESLTLRIKKCHVNVEALQKEGGH